MKTFASTHTGLVRKKNEDRYLIREITGGSVLLAVADGMGGETAGDYAAELILSIIADVQQGAVENEQHISQLVKNADRAISDKVEMNSALEGMGSTVICALVRDDIFYWAHVGDSRLYVLREKELTRVTTDQNMAQFLLEEGDITTEEARLHPSRNQLDQCVGCGDCIPETGRMEIKTGDLLILTTDGLHGEITTETISSILTSPTDIETKAKFLIQAALDAGGKDNMTMVIAEI